MKRLVFLCVFVFLVCALYANTWNINSYIDQFGDSTDSKYISTGKQYGTFSNSATTNSNLEWKILVDDSSVSIFLYEYGSYVVNNRISYGTPYYLIQVRDQNGTDYEFTSYCVSDRLKVIDRKGFLSLLLNNESLKIYISEVAYGSTYNLGTFDVGNFKTAYENVFGTGSTESFGDAPVNYKRFEIAFNMGCRFNELLNENGASGFDVGLFGAYYFNPYFGIGAEIPIYTMVSYRSYPYYTGALYLLGRYELPFKDRYRSMSIDVALMGGIGLTGLYHSGKTETYVIQYYPRKTGTVTTPASSYLGVNLLVGGSMNFAEFVYMNFTYSFSILFNKSQTRTAGTLGLGIGASF